MKGKALEKVPRGKLLRVEVNFDKKITWLRITGDFFAHPEDSIEKVEDMIVGLPVDFNQNKFALCLDDFIKRKDYELIGLDASAIIRVLKKAMENPI